MPTLYVTATGSRVEKHYGRFRIMRHDEVLLAVPINRVSGIVLVGHCGITTPALQTLLTNGASLSLVSRTGRLSGRLVAPNARNITLRHQQYKRSHDPQFCLSVAQQFVHGKLINCRTMIRRIGRADRHRQHQFPERTVLIVQSARTLTQAIDRIPTTTSLSELRSVEANAAKAWYRVYRIAVRQGFHFERRSKRPPKDPTNAMMSFTYMLLKDSIFSACEVAGLDPWDGFYHADKYGRPALALDLMEEFRHIVADSVVLTAINKRMIKHKNFEEDNNQWRLDDVGLRKLIRLYERRLQTLVFHPIAGRRISMRKIFEVQARQLRKTIENDDTTYVPFCLK